MGSKFEYSDNEISFKAQLVPWDTNVFGFNCAQIYDLVAHEYPKHGLPTKFKQWLVKKDIQFISCRIDTNDMYSGFLLEEEGFKFIEVNLHPTIRLDQRDFENFEQIDYRPALELEIDEVRSVALRSFDNERFHLDPRIPNEKADLRYANWVLNATSDPAQDIFVLRSTELDSIIGFFITEQSEGKNYWHLTAIDPSFHSRGLGFMSWSTVLASLKSNGVKEVTTTISAKNSAVLSLYSKLSFRFGKSSKTYHWLC